jgi:hypothetical protein
MIPSILVLTALVSMPAPTNLELAESAVLEAVSEIPGDLAELGVETVVVEMAGEHGAGWLLEQTVTSELSAAGIGVSVAEGEAARTGYRLRLRPMELEVRYGETSRSWLIGSKKVTRHATCQLSATLLGPSGEVMMASRYGADVSDRVAVSDLSQLAGDRGDPWLAPEMSEEGSGGILEPLIVSGVVASLIYLFYSSRAE